IPPKKLVLGYGKPIHDYQQIATVRWKALDIPETSHKNPPEGIPIDDGWGIYFTSTMHIPATGRYGFALTSDDGSIFWINETRILNNDKPHKMSAKTAIRVLEKGSYPIAVWYYQAFPDRYGIEFKAKYLGPPDVDSTVVEIAAPVNVEERSLVVADSVLNFANNSFAINEQAVAVLKNLAKAIEKSTATEITIVGHTDATGSAASNMLLSEKRASAVAAALQRQLSTEEVRVIIVGKGEEEPIAPNGTAAGRQQNRRVVVYW
ncbi:MAG: OmpA family protein, partial [Bacteroidota bacterium]